MSKENKIVLIRLSMLPKELREEYLRDSAHFWGNDECLSVHTEMPISTLSDIEFMREHMLVSWRVDEDEVDTDYTLLCYLANQGDAGAFIYRALLNVPEFELTDGTEVTILRDMEW